MKVSRREALETMENDPQDKRTDWYNLLFAKTVKHLEDSEYDLNYLKLCCREYLSKLTKKKKEEIDTEQKLLEALEKGGAIGKDNVWFIKEIFAKGLKLPDLEKEVEEYEAKSRSG